MFSPLVLFAFLGVLAGRVMAFDTFNITVNSVNMTALDILSIPDSPVKTACSANLTDTTNLVTACGQDPNCLCNAATVASLQNTETCMFHNLIATNKPAPDFRAGSNDVLEAYATACLQNNVVLAANQTALVLPSNWNGLFVAVLPLGGVVVAVGAGAFLGFSALYILSNLE
ncbi:hypothetical protein BDZ97DRAFT_1984425 [Flammula alnicola]|nr:hypothetical protein BDZ97DRAFT_1984425 [Flammula alnicola]